MVPFAFDHLWAQDDLIFPPTFGGKMGPCIISINGRDQRKNKTFDVFCVEKSVKKMEKTNQSIYADVGANPRSHKQLRTFFE